MITFIDAEEAMLIQYYASRTGCSFSEAFRRLRSAMAKRPRHSLTLGEWFDHIESERLTGTTESVA